MPTEPKDPFRDRETEDSTRDRVLIGIFIAALVGVIGLAALGLDGGPGDGRPQAAASVPSKASADTGRSACPPIPIAPSVDRNEALALEGLVQTLGTYPGAWEIAASQRVSASPSAKKGTDESEPQYVYYNGVEVAEIMFSKAPQGKIQAEIIWACLIGEALPNVE